MPSDAGAAASTPPVTSAAQAPADPRLADYRHALEQAGVGSAPPDGTLTAMAAGICAQLADGADPAAVADALGSWGEWGSDGSALSPAAIRTVYVDAAGDVYC
nr:DUF732 domain-containing protein [Rhodococcus sp. HNM0569]